MEVVKRLANPLILDNILFSHLSPLNINLLSKKSKPHPFDITSHCYVNQEKEMLTSVDHFQNINITNGGKM